MPYNPMRSSLLERWRIRKYTGEPLEYGVNFLDYVSRNEWFIIPSAPNHVQVRCEGCGNIIQLSITEVRDYDNHTVSSEGVVSPSIGHLPCGFHEWGVLENWNDH